MSFRTPRTAIAAGLVLFLGACTSTPAGNQPASDSNQPQQQPQGQPPEQQPQQPQSQPQQLQQQLQLPVQPQPVNPPQGTPVSSADLSAAIATEWAAVLAARREIESAQAQAGQYPAYRDACLDNRDAWRLELVAALTRVVELQQQRDSARTADLARLQGQVDGMRTVQSASTPTPPAPQNPPAPPAGPTPPAGDPPAPPAPPAGPTPPAGPAPALNKPPVRQRP